MHKILLTVAIAAIAGIATPAAAEEIPNYTITFKDGSFEPKTLHLPADTRVKLQVVNMEEKVIEFESNDMKAEKIIRSGKTGSVFVGPLPAGEYKFFDEFNMAAGEGVVTVQ